MNTLRTILATSCCMITMMSNAQIPNGGFETWTTKSFAGKTVNYVEGWSTFNMSSVMQNEPEMAEKSTDAYEGTYALKLTNKPNQYDLGAMTFSEYPMNKDEYSDKFPIQGKPTALNGFFKYDYTGSDSFSIVTMIYKNGENIGYGELKSGVKSGAYAPFSAPITYYKDEMPDSAGIMISASYMQPKHGSSLTIDALSFAGITTGVADKTAYVINAAVYPNPASEQVTIGFEQQDNSPVSIVAYDILGNEAATIASRQPFAAGSHRLTWNTSSLPAGIYLLRVSRLNSEKTIRVIIK
jgi:hypothetical protein